MPHTHTRTYVYVFIYYIAVINTVEKFTAKQNFHQLSAAAYAVDSARSSQLAALWAHLFAACQ